MKAIRLLAYFSILLLCGCQTVVIPPSEFPTIDTGEELHILVKGEDYTRFQKIMEGAFKELGYPGQLVVHRWPGRIDNSLPQIEIQIDYWNADGDADYWCNLILFLSNKGVKTSLGTVNGRQEGIFTAGHSSRAYKYYELAALDAVYKLYNRMIPYADLEAPN